MAPIFKTAVFSFVLGLFLIYGLFLSANSASALSCVVDTAINCAAAGRTPLLRMSDTNNAHAGTMGGSAYANILCCLEPGVTIDTTNTGTENVNYSALVNLKDTDNSHVEKSSYSNYGNKAWIHVNIGNIACGYGSGGCLAGDMVASISGDTNAHIGDSASYNTKICCVYSSMPILSVSAAPGSIDSSPPNPPTLVQFTVTSGGTSVPGITVTLTSGFVGTCTSDALGQCTVSITAASAVTVIASDPLAAYADSPSITVSINAVATPTPTPCVPSCTSTCGGNIDPVCGTVCPLNDGAFCNDGDACTTVDACSGGSCVGGSPVICNDYCSGLMRYYSGSCDSGSGSCISYSSENCDGGESCKNYTCDPSVCDWSWKAPTCSVFAVPNPINMADSTVLTWNTTCANAGSISPTVGAVTPVPSYTAADPSSTGNSPVGPLFDNVTYNMAASGPGGNVACNVPVIINPPSCSLAVNPNEIYSEFDEPVELSWTDLNTTGAFINPGGISANPPPLAARPLISGLPDSGSATVHSPATANYIMRVSGPGGLSSCQATLLVGQPPCPYGGLVPCGRGCDNPETLDINESSPCNICAMFYMLKNIVNYLITLALGIGLFVTIIAGLLYAFSSGDAARLGLAKSAISSVIASAVIIFIAWLAVAVILQALGYANVGVWNQVSCNVKPPSACVPASDCTGNRPRAVDCVMDYFEGSAVKSDAISCITQYFGGFSSPAPIKALPCGDLGNVVDDGAIDTINTLDSFKIDTDCSIVPCSALSMPNGDVNADGSVNNLDADEINSYLNGTISTFTGCP